jgi:alcohol dehydrogenase YqhD (iron-dependent ADH family)
MNNFVWHSPCKIIFGAYTQADIAAECSQYGKKVLIVYGSERIKSSGLFDYVTKQLRASGLEFFQLGGVLPNPRLSTVRDGVAICKKEKVDFILAIGGGSVIDSAKAIAVGAKYSGDVWDFYMNKGAITETLPLGCILTLAATGSECNGNSVISDWDSKMKRAVGTPLLLPKFSILDPALTATVPREHTVYGMVDIMAHVFEQYFSPTKSTYLVDRMSEAVMKTVVAIGPKLLTKLDDYDYRAEILWSGTQALNLSLSCGKDTDFASHMIEHEVSAIYDIPHGGGLAIIFPNWMKYVYKADISKFYNFAVNVWAVDPKGKSDETVALEGIDATRNFFTSLGAPSTLAHYKIGGDKIDEMAEKCTMFGPVGGFRKIEKQDVAAILKMCL